MPDFEIKVTTPADFTGLEGIRPRLEDVERGLERAKLRAIEFGEKLTNATTGTNFSQRLDAQLKAFGDAHFAGKEAEAQRFQAAKTSASKRFDQDGGISSQAEAAAFGLPKLAAWAAALKVVSDVSSEIAENDRAAVALEKFGISAEMAARNAEKIDKLELFFDGNRQQAAETFGKIINGNTQGLEGLGIQLEKNSTLAQRMAAVDQLAARGAAAAAAQNRTLTGSLGLLARGFVDVVANGAQWLAEVTGLTAGLGWLNEKLGFVDASAKSAAASEANMAGETKNLTAALQDVPETANQATQAISSIQAAAQNAANSLKVMTDALNRAGKQPGDDEMAALEDRLAVLNGEDESEVKRRRAETNYRIAQDARQRDANNAETALAAAKKTLAELDALEKKNNQHPSRKRASDLTLKERDGSLTEKETEELANLRERRRIEDEAINEQRRRATEAERQANALKTGLPARRQRDELQKQIADKEAEKALKEKEEKESADKDRRDLEREKVQREMAQDARKREMDQATAEGAAKREREANAEAMRKKADEFRSKFGNGVLARESLAQIEREASRGVQSGADPEKAFDQAASPFIKTDKKTGEQKLMPRSLQASADRESPLDKYQRENAGRAAAPQQPATPLPDLVGKQTETNNLLAQLGSLMEAQAKQLQALEQRLRTAERQQGK